jgi:hypothetical protein
LDPASYSELTCHICEIWIGRYRSKLSLPLSGKKNFHFLWALARSHTQNTVIHILSLRSCLPACLPAQPAAGVLPGSTQSSRDPPRGSSSITVRHQHARPFRFCSSGT